MSDRDRLLDTAIRLGLVALILLGGIILVPLAIHGNDLQDRRRYRVPLEFCNSLDAQERAESIGLCAEARAQADLQAQQQMAFWSFTQAVIGGVGLLGLVFTVIYARNAWREARRATANAREQFELDRRAWLTASVEATNIFVNEELSRAACNLRIRAVNIGKSPALSVAFWVNPVPLDFWEEATEVSDLAEQIERARMQTHPFGGYVFPQEERLKFFTITIDPTVPRDWPGTFHFITGWVQYRLVKDGPSHFTPFAVNLLYWFDATKGGWVAHTQMVAVSIAPD